MGNQPLLFNRPLLCSMFSGSKMARFTLLAVLLVSLLLTMSPATLAKENAHDHMTFISFMELFEPMDGKPGSLLHLGDAVIEIPVGSLKDPLTAFRYAKSFLANNAVHTMIGFVPVGVGTWRLGSAVMTKHEVDQLLSAAREMVDRVIDDHLIVPITVAAEKVKEMEHVAAGLKVGQDGAEIEIIYRHLQHLYVDGVNYEYLARNKIQAAQITMDKSSEMDDVMKARERVENDMVWDACIGTSFVVGAVAASASAPVIAVGLAVGGTLSYAGLGVNALSRSRTWQVTDGWRAELENELDEIRIRRTGVLRKFWVDLFDRIPAQRICALVERGYESPGDFKTVTEHELRELGFLNNHVRLFKARVKELKLR